jgi:choline monooxygenase
MSPKYNIDPDINKSETIPASFYKDPEIFELTKEKIFVSSWQWIGKENIFSTLENVYPFFLLDGFLSEPMILVSTEKNNIKCFSNVCTHRGNIIVHEKSNTKQLICKYHGRQFGLDGSFRRMPEFGEVRDFPRACDHLPEFPLTRWQSFMFVGLQTVFEISEVLKKMNERVGFLPISDFKHEKHLSRDYLVNSHWALYCDNYLEGFHIPFVHGDLNSVLDYGSYTTHLYDYMNLQIGYTDNNSEAFDLPKEHPDYGKNVAAYYYWIFPNMMFNYYPWGLSVNIVKPLSINKTRVSFITYIYDDTKLDKGAGAILDQVEKEDEFVVEGVQKGIQSRFYHNGRFSPTKEQGVHHFHSLLADFLC